MKSFVRLKNENTVGKIHFFHPKGNNLPTTIIKGLIDCLQKAEKDPDINVVILESGGNDTFCSGASLSELKSIKNISSLISLIVIAIIARFITPEPFGIYIFCLASREIITTICAPSLSQTYLFSDGTKSDFKNVCKIALLFSIIILIASIIGGKIISNHFES